MYILNLNDERTRCVLVSGSKELDLMIRCITRNGIWVNSLYWVDNTEWYQVCYEQFEFIYTKNIKGIRLRDFYDMCNTDGGRVLAIAPWRTHAHV